MYPPDPDQPPHEHHAKIRRTKRLLRFAPRRARLHRIPLLGRFAGFARQRSYLWSFKPDEVRRAFYAGSVLALLPVMGVQIPLSLGLALLLRANFMVAGGLQFITNPFTAAPVYYVTYQVGKKITGWVRSLHQKLFGIEAELQTEIDEALTVELSLAEGLPGASSWASGFGFTVSALVVGGAVCGLTLGALLDLVFTRSRSSK